MKTKGKKEKKLDFFDIKKALPDLPSANLELVIMDCAHFTTDKEVKNA